MASTNYKLQNYTIVEDGVTKTVVVDYESRKASIDNKLVTFDIALYRIGVYLKSERDRHNQSVNIKENSSEPAKKD